MHLAILMTNTDESDFAQRHPRDGEKFTAMIRSVRPDWTSEVFAVKDGVFPRDLSRFDGVIITGSPASVHDSDPWVARLEDLIRDMVAKDIPLFGACYGHQAIAKALGGKIGPNPCGWVFGRTEMTVEARPIWMSALPASIGQYAAHIEQVSDLPAGARVVLSSPHCPAGGFVIGTKIYTTQNHPEMTPEFIAALVDVYAPKLPQGVGAAARESLSHPIDGRAYAESIARFFEVARDGGQ